MTGRVDGPKTQVAHGDVDVVVEESVVARQEVSVLLSDPDVDASLAHRRDRSDVVPVTVGLEDTHDAEALHDLQQTFVFVGGVDQGGVAGAATAHHVDVVVDRTDHQTVHFGGGVGPDECDRVHGASLPERVTSSRTLRWCRP